jgi:hypothetical protein
VLETGRASPKSFDQVMTPIGEQHFNVRHQLSLPQEFGEKLLDGLGLVGQDHVVGIFDQLDSRVGQLVSESGCCLWPVMA